MGQRKISAKNSADADAARYMEVRYKNVFSCGYKLDTENTRATNQIAEVNRIKYMKNKFRT